jgi:hypothetical protein
MPKVESVVRTRKADVSSSRAPSKVKGTPRVKDKGKYVSKDQGRLVESEVPPKASSSRLEVRSFFFISFLTLINACLSLPMSLSRA